MIKLIKDSTNKIIAYGPNDEHYDPTIPTDCTVEIVSEMPIIAPTQEEIQQVLLAKLDEHIDNTAKSKGYDNRVTCTIRAGYINPWQQEGITFGQWMDSCYVKAYQIQADVLAGTRTTPTAEELIAEMPVVVWPV